MKNYTSDNWKIYPPRICRILEIAMVADFYPTIWDRTKRGFYEGLIQEGSGPPLGLRYHKGDKEPWEIGRPRHIVAVLDKPLERNELHETDHREDADISYRRAKEAHERCQIMKSGEVQMLRLGWITSPTDDSIKAIMNKVFGQERLTFFEYRNMIALAEAIRALADTEMKLEYVQEAAHIVSQPISNQKSTQ